MAHIWWFQGLFAARGSCACTWRSLKNSHCLWPEHFASSLCQYVNAGCIVRDACPCRRLCTSSYCFGQIVLHTCQDRAAPRKSNARSNIPRSQRRRYSFVCMCRLCGIRGAQSHGCSRHTVTRSVAAALAARVAAHAATTLQPTPTHAPSRSVIQFSQLHPFSRHLGLLRSLTLIIRVRDMRCSKDHPYKFSR